MKIVKAWAGATIVTLIGTAHAALVSLGDGTVQDTNTNLIWLRNWDVNGQADWSTQKNWADNLDFAGSSDWALPSIGEYRALFGAYGDLTRATAFNNVQADFYCLGLSDTCPSRATDARMAPP